MTYGYHGQTIRDLLCILAKKEGHPAAILTEMKKRSMVFPEGNGFLIPLLYLLEREGLISSRSADLGEGKRRLYSITPYGLLYLKKGDGLETEAPSDNKNISAQKFTSNFDELLRSEIRDRRAKKRLLQDVRDYTTDVGVDNFGDPNALCARMGEIVREKGEQLSLRVVLTTVGISLLVVGAVVLLWLAWGVFVPQCIGIVLGAYLLLRLIKGCRILTKRAKAIRKIVRIAKDAGYTVEKKETALGSLLLKHPYPTLVLRGGDTAVKIRFAAATARVQIIRFESPFIYQRVNLRGLAMGVMHPFFRRASFFRPKGMNGSLFQLTYTDLVEFEKGMVALPILDKRFDGGLATREVVLLNPPPMKVLYRDGGQESELVGGEIKDGVEINDVFGFCCAIAKAKE